MTAPIQTPPWQSAVDACDLNALHDAIWSRLEAATQTTPHPWRLPVLGTATLSACHLRIVTLRRVEREAFTLSCHTDVRSIKVAEIRRQPRIEWLFYDSQERVQVRVAGDASLHTDDAVADGLWAGADRESRRLYLAPNPPGIPVDRPDANQPKNLVGREPTLEESDAGRVHFAVVRCQAMLVDWLWLNPAGHVRAEFRRSDNGWQGTWITP